MFGRGDATGASRHATARRGGRVAVGLVWLIVTAVLVVGCSPASGASRAASASAAGGDGPGALTGGGWAGDVCGLLSVAEIAADTGLDVAVGRTSTAGSRDCVWYSDRGAVTVAALGGRTAFDSLRQQYMTSAVPGVGDAAYWLGATGELVLMAHGVVVSVNVDLPDPHVSYADALQLAALIVPRL